MRAVIFLIILSLNAFAGGGDGIGNGGDVVVCGNKVEMLDLYEARFNGAVVDLGKKDQDHMVKVNHILNRKNEFQPTRIKQYLEWAKSFKKEARFVRDRELEDIDDAGVTILPRGCVLKQIAVQVSEPEILRGAPRYVVDQDLWERLDESNKAVLVLHEILYRDGIRHNQQNSMRVRRLNQAYLAQEFNEEEFLKFTMMVSKDFVELGGFLFVYPEKYTIERDQKAETILAMELKDWRYSGERRPYISSYNGIKRINNPKTKCDLIIRSEKVELNVSQRDWARGDDNGLLKCQEITRRGIKVTAGSEYFYFSEFKSQLSFPGRSVQLKFEGKDYTFELNDTPEGSSGPSWPSDEGSSSDVYEWARSYVMAFPKKDGETVFKIGNGRLSNGERSWGGKHFTFDLKSEEILPERQFVELEAPVCWPFQEKNVCATTYYRNSFGGFKLENKYPSAPSYFELPVARSAYIINLKYSGPYLVETKRNVGNGYGNYVPGVSFQGRNESMTSLQIAGRSVPINYPEAWNGSETALPFSLAGDEETFFLGNYRVHYPRRVKTAIYLKKGPIYEYYPGQGILKVPDNYVDL